MSLEDRKYAINSLGWKNSEQKLVGYKSSLGPPESKIIREEASVLKELRNDRSWVVPTVDRRVTMVMLDKQEYISKAQDLLGYERHLQNLYLAADLTNKQKTKLVNILGTI